MVGKSYSYYKDGKLAMEKNVGIQGKGYVDTVKYYNCDNGVFALQTCLPDTTYIAIPLGLNFLSFLFPRYYITMSHQYKNVFFEDDGGRTENHYTWRKRGIVSKFEESESLHYKEDGELKKRQIYENGKVVEIINYSIK